MDVRSVTVPSPPPPGYSATEEVVVDSVMTNNCSNDVDKWIQQVSLCKFLPEEDMRRLCEMTKAVLVEESNVKPVSSPVSICGDIHGQFWDLLELFRVGGEIPPTNYVFMGDFVDRGHNSLETFTLLMALKVRFPEKITLIRGNHECRLVTQVHGFFDECQRKHGNTTVWKYCTDVFDLLPLAALIDGRVLCVHGGLSPELHMIDDFQKINRNQEIPYEGGFCHLMWSDPDADLDGWRPSPRGSGLLFGANVTNEFMGKNNLELICRAHQLVNEGYQYLFDKKLVTVWSAPNYCYRCGNVASILQIDEYLNQNITIFQAASKNSIQQQLDAAKPAYFL